MPSFAVPFGYEQAMWGRRIAKLGAGIRPLLPEKLTAETLAFAIDKVTDTPRLRHRAAELARTIQTERGVERAVEIVERTLHRSAASGDLGQRGAA